MLLPFLVFFERRRGKTFRLSNLTLLLSFSLPLQPLLYPPNQPTKCQHCYVNYGTTLAGLVLTPHAPHHEKHRCQQPPKQQQESGAAAAVANDGDGKDPDPVAAASAELAAAREEDSRVEREMHEFYKHWHDEASFLSFWVLEVEGRKITRYKKKPPIFCFVSPLLPLPPPLFRSTPPSLTSRSSHTERTRRTSPSRPCWTLSLPESQSSSSPTPTTRTRRGASS